VPLKSVHGSVDFGIVPGAVVGVALGWHKKLCTAGSVVLKSGVQPVPLFQKLAVLAEMKSLATATPYSAA